MSNMSNVARGVVAAAALFALAACSATYRNHGYTPLEADLERVAVGQDTRESVADKIGYPGSEGLREEDAWYYVQSRWRHFTYNEPEEVDREVLAISFAANDTVANVERFGLEEGEVVALSRRVTDTSTVRGAGTLRRLFGNLGGLDPRRILGD